MRVECGVEAGDLGFGERVGGFGFDLGEALIVGRAEGGKRASEVLVEGFRFKVGGAHAAVLFGVVVDVVVSVSRAVGSMGKATTEDLPQIEGEEVPPLCAGRSGSFRSVSDGEARDRAGRDEGGDPVRLRLSALQAALDPQARGVLDQAVPDADGACRCRGRRAWGRGPGRASSEALNAPGRTMSPARVALAEARRIAPDVQLTHRGLRGGLP